MTKQEKECYQKMVGLIDEKIVFPTYTEECKKKFFHSIKENGINNDSRKKLDKIFDKDSDLYNNPYVEINYDVEQILSNINENEYHSCQDLGSMVFSDIEGYYFSETKRLNPDVDPDIIHDLPSYDFTDFYYEVLEHISVDELKKYIMKLADRDWFHGLPIT